MGYFINSYEEDTWRIPDEFDTREDAIAEGIQQYKDAMNGLVSDLFGENDEDGNIKTTFYIGKKHKFKPYVSADYIIEQVGYDAYYECGEVAEDYLDDVPKEIVDLLQEKVQFVFDAWLEENNLQPNFCNVINIEEIDVKDYM